MQEFHFQLSVSQRREESLKEQNDELNRLTKKYQEQRDFYNEERRKAMNEREEARKERDEITQRYSDVLKEKDEAVIRFLQESREFERQRELDTTEMHALRERLIRAEEELKILKMEGELSLRTSVSNCILFLYSSKYVSSFAARHEWQNVRYWDLIVSGVYINWWWEARIFSFTMDFPNMTKNFSKISKYAIEMFSEVCEDVRRLPEVEQWSEKKQWILSNVD